MNTFTVILKDWEDRKTFVGPFPLSEGRNAYITFVRESLTTGSQHKTVTLKDSEGKIWFHHSVK